MTRAASGGADPMQSLARAVRSNDAAGVAEVLARHPEVKARLDEPLPDAAFGATALLAAVHCGGREVVDLLLDAGANINQRSHWWAGSFGVLDGDTPLVPYLIERGATIDAHAAARLGRLDRLRELVNADPALVHARGGDGQTPLHFASSVEVAQLLLHHGAEIDARDVDHEATPAQWMIRDRQEVARFLVARGARTDILMAAALGDLARVRRHLADDAGAIHTAVTEEFFPKRDPRAGGHIYIWTLGAGKTAHLVAREFGHEEVYRFLMSQTPEDLQLAIACDIGDDDLRQALLARSPRVAASLSASALRRLPDAARDENADAVRRFLASGWVVGSRAGFPGGDRGQHGGTTLHWAAWHGNAELVKELLQRGADPEAKDDDYGSTPLGWAIHASRHGWHPHRGDYAGAADALLSAGATLPARLDDVDASAPVMAVLRRHHGGRTTQ